MFGSNLFKEIYGFAQEAIAPAQCVACGQWGNWLCFECAEELVYVSEQACPRCGKLIKAGQVCPRCRRKMDLDGLVVAMHFQEGAVREIIHRFKYNEMLVLAEIMVPILVTTWRKHGVKCDAVTSVPLHYWRMKKRGYNQAEVLARKLAADCGLVYENVLARMRNTVSQTGLTRTERQENLYRAFKTCRQVKGRSWLIIDDVATTGATLEEAARALKDGGAKRVWGLVIARG